MWLSVPTNASRACGVGGAATDGARPRPRLGCRAPGILHDPTPPAHSDGRGERRRSRTCCTEVSCRAVACRRACARRRRARPRCANSVSPRPLKKRELEAMCPYLCLVVRGEPAITCASASRDPPPRLPPIRASSGSWQHPPMHRAAPECTRRPPSADSASFLCVEAGRLLSPGRAAQVHRPHPRPDAPQADAYYPRAFDLYDPLERAEFVTNFKFSKAGAARSLRRIAHDGGQGGVGLVSVQ